MPVIINIILSSLGKALLHIILKASTQKMMERMVIMALEYLSKRTTSPVDDDLVASIKLELAKPVEEAG